MRGNLRRSHFLLTERLGETAAGFAGSYSRLQVSVISVTGNAGKALVVSLRNMTCRLKFVASALVVILLAMPLSALGSCWWQMTAVEHCTPRCPMMSAHAPSVTIQEAPANNSCCRVSAAKLTPASMPQGPSASGSRVAPTLIASALDTPAILTKSEPPDPLARASCPSAQSVFCTFLI